VPLGAGVLLERGRQKRGTPLKRRHFAVIGLNNVTRNLSKAHETRESL